MPIPPSPKLRPLGSAVAYPSGKRAASSRAGTSTYSVYLPVTLRGRAPLGFVTTQAELATTKVQAGRGAQPSADAVESVLENADEALADVVTTDPAETAKNSPATRPIRN